MSSADVRRWSDYDALAEMRSHVIKWVAKDFEPAGQIAPSTYQVHFDLRSIIGWNDNEPIYHTGFDILLDTSDPYPLHRCKAQFVGQIPLNSVHNYNWKVSGRKANKMLIGQWPWHPNVHPDNGLIDFGDTWIRGIGIQPHQVLEIIGGIIAFQLYSGRDQHPIILDPAFWHQFENYKHLFPTDLHQIVQPQSKKWIKFKK